MGEILAGEPGKSREYHLDSIRLSLTENSQVQIRGLIAITKTAKDTLIAQGEFEAEITGECSRCLDQAKLSTVLRLAQEYALSPQADEEILPIENGQINLAEALYYEALMNTPTVFLCRSDCLGLCPECGVNLNREEHKEGCGNQVK